MGRRVYVSRREGSRVDSYKIGAYNSFGVRRPKMGLSWQELLSIWGANPLPQSLAFKGPYMLSTRSCDRDNSRFS